MSDTDPNKGASGKGEEAQVTEPTVTSVEPTAKFEIVDGKVTVDGRSYVAESDLIAAKKSLETKLTQAQTEYASAIDNAKLSLSESQNHAASLTAKISELKDAGESGAVSAEEIAKAKQDLVEVTSGRDAAIAKVLELRRANIVLQSQGTVKEEQLASKNLAQLDAFEEALKALGSSRGNRTGAYAIGAVGSDSIPKTPMERAAAVLANTPVRGVRNPATE